MRPGRPFGLTRRWDLALLMLAITGAAEREFERICGSCGATVQADETCCPEPCS